MLSAWINGERAEEINWSAGLNAPDAAHAYDFARLIQRHPRQRRLG
jgi:hypothetical protein